MYIQHNITHAHGSCVESVHRVGVRASIIGPVVHGLVQSGPEEPLAGVWLALIAGIVQIENVGQKSWNCTCPVQHWNQHVLLAICKGGRR